MRRIKSKEVDISVTIDGTKERVKSSLLLEFHREFLYIAYKNEGFKIYKKFLPPKHGVQTVRDNHVKLCKDSLNSNYTLSQIKKILKCKSVEINIKRGYYLEVSIFGTDKKRGR